ncbi:MAG TPA: cytochrome c maturation protein CcmE [Anaerolineae bacterium]|nr:cytochrome c maturation protein CcmE [Anaerolineae bacterium]HNU04409.1 cytochrome c maturation protein CcmE [Anaerolineae bacterium]
MTESTILTGPQLEAKPANRKFKFLIGAVVIFVAIGFLVFNAMSSAGAYYMTVPELTAQAEQYVGKNVRVSGVVIDESVDYNASELILRFSIGEEGNQLPIYFHGPRPDNFVRAAEAIVEGKLGEDGVLYANSLLLKCPSRYEEHGGEQKPMDYEEIQVESIG